MRKLLFLLLFFTSISSMAQTVDDKTDSLSNNKDITFFYDTFILDDLICYQVVKNNVLVTICAEPIEQYGRFFRLKIEICNLTNERFTFYPNNIKAKIIYDDIEYNTQVYDYKHYAARIRKSHRLKFALEDVSNTFGSEVYDINDFREKIYGRFVNYPYKTANISYQYVFGRDLNSEIEQNLMNNNSKNILKRNKYQLNVTNNADVSYAVGNYYRYRSELVKSYLRANTLNPMSAISGYVMVKRRAGSHLFVEMTVGKENFQFEWNIKSLKDADNGFVF